MLIESSKNNLLNFTAKFYWAYISHDNYQEYINIFITDDIMNDYKLFTNNHSLTTEPSALTLLPQSNNEKITLLFSQHGLDVAYIIHELTHVCDFLLFANTYCDSQLDKIESHSLYQTFVYWSEFHVKLFEIPYTHIVYGILQGQNFNRTYSDFVNKISTFYFPKITQKMLHKIQNDGVFMRDIMYYLGEIEVCNLHDPHNTYIIDEVVLKKFPFLPRLNHVLKNCKDFDSFVLQSEILDDLYNN